MKCACLLVTHGSRDPRHHLAAEQLRLRVAQNWPAQSLPIVGLATLELAPEPLSQQIVAFVRYLQTRGFDRLQIIPVFLLAGTHVMDDIPREISLAQQMLGDTFTLELRPHLGSHPQWSDWLSRFKSNPRVEQWILFAHGSRRTSAHHPIQSLANQLGAELAYWSTAPSLVEQVETLVKQGHQQIGVLPYLLFPGGITDILQQTCKQLEHQFPQLNLHLLPALDANPELANLIIDLL